MDQSGHRSAGRSRLLRLLEKRRRAAGRSCAALPRGPGRGHRPDRTLAAGLYIGITPHRAVDLALAAVDIVHNRMQQMQASGGMKPINQTFKAARAVTPSLRYARDHLDAFKLKPVEEVAAQMS
jgi:hypothetical protein